MKELTLVLVSCFIGISFGFFVVGDAVQFTEILGTTYSELSSMKEECEHSLPRNQHCETSIIFLPTASEE